MMKYKLGEKVYYKGSLETVVGIDSWYEKYPLYLITVSHLTDGNTFKFNKNFWKNVKKIKIFNYDDDNVITLWVKPSELEKTFRR